MRFVPPSLRVAWLRWRQGFGGQVAVAPESRPLGRRTGLESAKAVAGPTVLRRASPGVIPHPQGVGAGAGKPPGINRGRRPSPRATPDLWPDVPLGLERAYQSAAGFGIEWLSVDSEAPAPELPGGGCGRRGRIQGPPPHRPRGDRRARAMAVVREAYRWLETVAWLGLQKGFGRQRSDAPGLRAFGV
jgi:hypothetical protein